MSRVVKGVNDLQTRRPDLVEEWDFERNTNILPSDVTVGSNRVVWWKGKCGHEWQTTIWNRSRGRKCPYCTRRYVSPGVNDMLTENPAFKLEWDYEKNRGVTPEKLLSGSSKIVWWKCPRNHSYQQPIFRHKANCCPICTSEVQTSFPEQAIVYYFKQCTEVINRWKQRQYEIDIYLPKYSIGIEYDGEYYHQGEQAKRREERKEMFFKSIGIKIIRVKESTTNKVENDNSNMLWYKPSANYASLNNVIIHLLGQLELKLPNDNIVDIARDQNEIMHQYIMSVKEHSLQIRAPHLVDEWCFEKNLISPDYVSAGSNKKFWWVCKNGHTWQASVASRVNGNGCPYCSGLFLVEGENDLLSQNPTLVKEWNYDRNGNLMPNNISVNNGKKVWWICSVCGHEWQASVAHRNMGKGCPVCGNQNRGKSMVATRIKKNGTLFDSHPELKTEWDSEKNRGISPDELTEHSGRKVWWICSACGYNWPAFVSNRARGHGCPKCAAKKANLKRQQQRLVEKRSNC